MPRWAIVTLALLTVGVLVVVAFLAVFGARQVVRRIGEIEIEPPAGRDEFPLSNVAECLRKVQADIGPGLDTGESPEAGDPIQAVAARVERIRGLKFTKPPEPRFLSTGEFSRRVMRDFEREFTDEEAKLNSRLLSVLGAMPAGADLKELIANALGAGVLGFYDDDSGELVVRDPEGDRDISPMEEVVLAHELDHALTDQVLDLPAIVDEDDPGSEDSSTAALSLVEGDASLVDAVYATAGLSSDERDGFGFPFSKGRLNQLETLPHFIQRELSFPYMEGLQFVCHLVSNGGWPRVDAAYKDLPQTSAQILFPDRYDKKEAAFDPPDPGRLDDPWKAERKFAIGAAPMLFLFEAPGGDTGRAVNSPLQSSSAWTGGELQLWSRGEASALGIALMQRPQGRMCDAVKSWYSKAFPTSRGARTETGEVLAVDGVDQDAVIRCSGTEVRVGIAPDLTTARQLIR